MAEWEQATWVVRAGLPDAEPGTPYLPGPVFAAPYHAPGDPTQSRYTYGRFDNPTWTAYESALASLEGGPCVLFPSGMAATHGDAILRAIDAAEAPVAMVWLESPTNPQLDVCDIAAIAAHAHARGALVVVDNTTATPLLQQPLSLGADVCVVSDTKAMTGHADLLLGHAAARDAGHAEMLRTWRTRLGVIPGPMEAWLAHRSLGTLHVRLMQQCRSAQIIAEYLAERAERGSSIRNVRYPGLPGDRSHPLAVKQMSQFGAVISFEVPDAAAAARFFAASRLVYEATSFGGLHTSAERRARWGGDAVSAGFIRLSVGLEDVNDLVRDLAQALDAI